MVEHLAAIHQCGSSGARRAIFQPACAGKKLPVRRGVVRLLGGSDLTICPKAIFCCGTNPVLIFFIAFAGLLGSVGSASAQGIFEALFGRWTGSDRVCRSSPANQSVRWTGKHPLRGRPVAYCVRTMRRTLFSDPAPWRNKPCAGVQLVLPRQAQPRFTTAEQHRPCGRHRRQALRRAQHRFRV